MPDKLGAIHDVAEQVALSAGAIANLAILGAGRRVPEHVHANPYLWLHVLGCYAEDGDGGALTVNGPTAIFFPAGSAHRMSIGDRGLASVIVEFDAERLRGVLGPRADLRRPRRWIGGRVGRRAGEIARMWLGSLEPDAQRFARTEFFLATAMAAEPARQPSPPWLQALDAEIETGAAARTDRLAERFGVSAPWLARAYRSWRGEGVAERVGRRRVEAAAILLETEKAGLAEIAAAAGFCDQSHMTRAFKRQLGRTPGEVRASRLGLAGGG
jgi:AraC family transcriptional regulator